MKYILSWTDSTLTENYKSEDEMIKEFADMGIIVSEEGYITDNENWNENGEWGIGWYDYYAVHAFEANSDQEAIEYTKKFEFGMRDVEVFTLKGVDTGLYWTEENWNEEWRQPLTGKIA
jgi:hypothetical protein